MQELAEQVVKVLEDAVGADQILGVSYYDADGVGHVYRSDWTEAKFDSDQVDAIVEELRFESLGHVAHEEHQKEELHATVRIYDDMLDVAVPATENRGVVFALDIGGDYTVRELVETVEAEIRSAETVADE